MRPGKPKALIGSLLVLLLMPVARVHGQAYDRWSGQVSNPRAYFRADAARVLIPFVALDKNDGLVRGISSRDVQVFAGGKEREVQFLSMEDGPASVLFVVDISGSMKKPVTDVKEAMRRILRAAYVDDEFALVEFSDRPKVTVDFTSVQSSVEDRIEQISPSGHTSLIDAVLLGIREMAQAHQSRKALIILSDGQDNHSRYVDSEVLRAAIESNVRIYGVELNPPMGEGFTPQTLLERLSQATGGQYLPTVNRKQIPSIVERIDVHHGYVVGFTPTAEDRDGKLHVLDLKLKSKPTNGKVRLVWKNYYLVPTDL